MKGGGRKDRRQSRYAPGADRYEVTCKQSSCASSLGGLIPRIECREHPRAIPAATNGDANFGETTAIGRREVVNDGRVVADPQFPLVGNDGVKTGVEIALLTGVQGSVHRREDAQEGIGSEVESTGQ